MSGMFDAFLDNKIKITITFVYQGDCKGGEGYYLLITITFVYQHDGQGGGGYRRRVPAQYRQQQK